MGPRPVGVGIVVIRFLLIFLIAVGTFAALRILLAHKPLTVRRFMQIYFATLVGMMLIYLGVTGRLNWLFAFFGVALPIAARYLPWLLRFLNFHALYHRFRQFVAPQTATPDQKSELNTRFFAMVLDHDSGDMDGTVLQGLHQGALLSTLSLADLAGLLAEARADADSENVLRAFLDRSHPEWESSGDHSHTPPPPPSDGNLSVPQAYEVLGLDQDASLQDVREAHRRLIQKLHPDRGGSTYLAARINDAKSVLLAHLQEPDFRE